MKKRGLHFVRWTFVWWIVWIWHHASARHPRHGQVKEWWNKPETSDVLRDWDYGPVLWSPSCQSVVCCTFQHHCVPRYFFQSWDTACIQWLDDGRWSSRLWFFGSTRRPVCVRDVTCLHTHIDVLMCARACMHALTLFFWFLICYATTQITTPLHQRRGVQ